MLQCGKPAIQSSITLTIENKGSHPVKAGLSENKGSNMKNDTILILANVVLWFAILPLITHFI